MKHVSLKAAPTSWDAGASGIANRAGLREEAATDFDPMRNRDAPNPNGIRRWRRQTWVTAYRNQGHISAQQAAAADRLAFSAFGAGERDPLAGLGDVVVPASRDRHAARIDAKRAFFAMWASVPQLSRVVVERVVLDDQPIPGGNVAQRERHMQRLRAGLDAIA